MARWLALCLVGSVALCGWCGTACGQDPAVTTEAAQDPPVTTEAGPPDAVVVDEPSPLVKDPDTPESQLEAVILMLDLGRPRLARQYLDKLLANTLDDETLNRLRDQHGTDVFLRLTRMPELRPAANTLLRMSNEAAARLLQDPARIAAIVARLGSPATEEDAILELQSVGVAAVPPLLQILNDPARSAVHPAVMRGVVEIGEVGVPPLLAALDAPNPGMRANAATALGRLGSLEAEPYLWQPALSDPSTAVRQSARLGLASILKTTPAKLESLASAQVVKRLLETSHRFSRHQHRWLTAADGSVTLWVWDSQEGTPIKRLLPPAEADELQASRFATLALRQAPDRRDVQVQVLATSLAADSRRAGPGNLLPQGKGSAHDLALVSGTDVVDNVLSEAVRHGDAVVALAALEVLEQVGTKNLLQRGRGLIAALNAPDRRVQFAAATTVLRLDPVEPFRQSPRVVAILRRAVENVQRPRAVVAQSSPGLAAELGGFINELGYDSIVRYTGREAFREASTHGDIELVVLHAHLVRWVLSETIANLRADSRTAGIPIVVVGPESLRIKLENVLAHIPQVFFVAEQTEEVAGFASQLRPFLTRISPPLPEEVLAEHRSAAVSWLAHLASTRRTKVFPLTGVEESLADAVTEEPLAAEVLVVLGEIPSIQSQRMLHGVLADDTAPLERRVDAANKLASHIQRFGLLISRSQVDALHQLLPAATEPDLHSAIATVIGLLKPDAVLVGKRLGESDS